MNLKYCILLIIVTGGYSCVPEFGTTTQSTQITHKGVKGKFEIWTPPIHLTVVRGFFFLQVDCRLGRLSNFGMLKINFRSEKAKSEQLLGIPIINLSFFERRANSSIP